MSTPRSCCPPGSESYLISDYVPVGECITLSGGLEAYVTSSTNTSGKAVILLPDIYGWDGGHIRKIADLLSAEGYFTIVPKLLSPCMDPTEVDGDGVSRTFEMEGKMAELGAFMVIAHLRDLKITKAACLGFCWGGWMSAHALTEESWGDILVCAASPHPSMHIEGSDPDAYRPGGDIHDALLASSPQSVVIDTFKEMKHGWVVRGDMSDPKTAEDIALALSNIKDFISLHIA